MWTVLGLLIVQAFIYLLIFYIPIEHYARLLSIEDINPSASLQMVN